MSVFAVTGKASESDDMDDLPIDESRMEKAMQALAGEAENLNEDDPRQAADLMRKLTDMTGLELGSGMQEALKNQPVENFSDVPAREFASSQKRQVDYEASDDDEDPPAKPSTKKNFYKRDVEE